MKASIIGTGSYLPEKFLTNEELSKTVDTTDEDSTKSRYKSRYIAARDNNLYYRGSQRCSDSSKLDFSEINLILVRRSTPDEKMPSTAVSSGSFRKTNV